jgi:hypothetical protein
MSRDRRPIEEVAPDDFLSVWGASSYSEAIEKAQQASTTTPADELPRCPECDTRRIKHKTQKHEGQGAKDGAYVCTNRHHFDDPVYVDGGEATDDAEDVDDNAEEADDNAEEVDDPDDLAEKVDPFDWLTDDDLADPPLPRRLDELDDRRLAALVIYLYRPWSPTGPSYRELGSVLPYSSDWVGYRVREWKDGDHRDLVRDPRPRVPLAIDAEEAGHE